MADEEPRKPSRTVSVPVWVLVTLCLLVLGLTLREGVVIVTAVGNGIQDTPGVSGRIFSALGERGVNVIAIAQGGSECSISLIVSSEGADDAVRAIHDLIVA